MFFFFFHYWLQVWQECSVHIRTYARAYMYRLKCGKNIYNYCVFLRFNLLKMSCGKCWKWHFRDPKSTNFSGGESLPSIPTPRLGRLRDYNVSSPRAYSFKTSRYAPVFLMGSLITLAQQVLLRPKEQG